MAFKEYNGKIHDKTVKGDYKEIEIKYDEDDKKEDEKPKNEKNKKKKR